MTAEETIEKVWEIVVELVDIIVDYNLSHMKQPEDENASEDIQHVGYSQEACGYEK